MRHRRYPVARRTRHDFTTRENRLLRAADLPRRSVIQPFAQRNEAVSSRRRSDHGNARPGSVFSANGINLLFARQHAALEFKIFKAVAILRPSASRTTARRCSARFPDDAGDTIRDCRRAFPDTADRF